MYIHVIVLLVQQSTEQCSLNNEIVSSVVAVAVVIAVVYTEQRTLWVFKHRGHAHKTYLGFCGSYSISLH